MDLVRQLLLAIEARDDSDGEWFADVEAEGRDVAVVSYHIMLLAEAGLIEAHDASDCDGPDWMPRRLTWEGHEFLDAARLDGPWRRAVGFVKEKTGGLSFEILKQVLTKWASDAISATIPPP